MDSVTDVCSDHDPSTFDLSYSTPPLSPSKSTSTEGWSPPRTPCSPRKTRSCLFFRDISARDFPPAASNFSIKSSFASSLGVLHSSEEITPHWDWGSSPQCDGSPTRQIFRGLDGLPHRQSIPIIRSNTRSLPEAIRPQCGSKLSETAPDYEIAGSASSPTAIRSSEYRSLDQSSTHKTSSLPPTFVCQDTPSTRTIALELPSPSHSPNNSSLSNKLCPLSPRHSSSPLRPGQWVTRGGLLSNPRSQTRTPDRFISSRRPPNTTRDSFELNKPTHRLTFGERITRNDTTSADPFGRRLLRSGRLNEELQTLRETHSAITGRTNSNRRGEGLSLRRNSFTLGNRQVSAGAVWNVGGTSAVSDTVVGVPNGRGGMLGSGTNAPLYTSMFLSRSDPEAELEAYERRLALAFDVDQADRILEHSTPPNSPITTISSGPGLSPLSNNKHIWRDSAWTKDGTASCLFMDLAIYLPLC